MGSPFYDIMFPIFMLPLMALVSIGIHAAWKRGQLGKNRLRILGGFVVAAVLGLVLVYAGYGPGKWLTPFGVILGVWIIVSSLFDPIDRLRRRLSLSRAALADTGLTARLLAVPGVADVMVVAEEAALYIKVDTEQLDRASLERLIDPAPAC